MIIQKIFIITAPVIIYSYLLFVEYYNINQVSNVDPLNGCLYRLPICGWNLTHVFIFYLISKILEKYIKNKIKCHIFIFIIGVLWYIIEPILYYNRGKDQIILLNDNIVYSNVYVPRLDDLIFNIFGQMLFVFIKYLF